MTLTDLAAAIDAYTAAQPGPSPHATSIAGLTLVRADRPSLPMPILYRPALCLVAQGAKRGRFGATTVDYRAGQALVVGLETPGTGCVTGAAGNEPFLGAIVEFDLTVLREVLDGLPEPLAPVRRPTGGAFVAELAPEVTACTLRLVALLRTPRAIAALAPAIMRELCYWLLTGPAGGDVAAVVFGVNRSARLTAAIHLLRERFAEPIRIDDLAKTAHMSASTFHRTFKTMTSLTPLQYQKQLRLLEARALVLEGTASAETAGYRVGYESASHFSREYARMFGVPPGRDRANSRAVARTLNR